MREKNRVIWSPTAIIIQCNDQGANVILFSADNFRPYITSFQGNNCTDYINAVFVDVSIEIGNS